MKKGLRYTGVNRMRFTLIELLVSTVISSLHFLTQKTAVETKQRIPLFLKRGVGVGERGKTSFPVKRSFSPLPKSAFTLIELLVVIAIIAILAAILLPALNSARERGRAADCTAKIKTMGNGVMLYADAYDDWVPWAQIPWGDNYRYWVSSINDFIGGSGYWKFGWFKDDDTADSNKADSNFLCPTLEGTGEAASNLSGGSVYHNITYQYSNYVGRGEKFGQEAFSPRKMSRMESPTMAILVAEGDKYPDWKFEFGYGSPYKHYLGAPHAGKMNTLAADGHCEVMQDGYLDDQTNYLRCRTSYGASAW